MRVPDVIVSSVAFLGAGNADGRFIYAGTAFFIGVHEPLLGEEGFGYLVTARHNVENALRQYGNLCIRVNMRDGNSVQEFALPTAGWLFAENEASDVAMLRTNGPAGVDLLPINATLFATDEVISSHRVGVGDDLVVAGLFTKRYGRDRNIPIVRSGIISAMPSETLVDENSGLAYPAYLAEMRSFGGLSGSPVFVHLSPARPYAVEPKNRFFLLGLIRGHWDYWPDGTHFVPDESRAVNMGIAIVTPVTEILSILNDPSEAKWRRDRAREILRERESK